MNQQINTLKKLSLEEIQQELEDWIINKGNEPVIAALKTLLPRNTEPYKILIQISLEQKRNKSREIKGIDAAETIELKKRQLTYKLIEFISTLEEHQLKRSATTFSGPVAYWSCDRKKILDKFWEDFKNREKSKAKNHFYFLLERHYGQAISLVKRLIVSLNQKREKVKIGNIEQKIPLEVTIKPEFNKKACKTELQKAFNRTLPLQTGILEEQINTLAEFVDNIDEHYPAFKGHQYLPFIFKVELENAASWEGGLKEGFQVFIDEFCQLPETSAFTCVFFFIIEVQRPKANKSKKKKWFAFGKKEEATIISAEEMQKKVSSIQEIVNTPVTVLPPLLRVNREHLDDWLKQVLLILNQYDRDKALERLIEDLGGGEEWDMSPVESRLREMMETQQNNKRPL